MILATDLPRAMELSEELAMLQSKRDEAVSDKFAGIQFDAEKWTYIDEIYPINAQEVAKDVRNAVLRQLDALIAAKKVALTALNVAFPEPIQLPAPEATT